MNVFKSMLAVIIALYHIYSLAFGQFDLYVHRIVSTLGLQLLMLLTGGAKGRPGALHKAMNSLFLLMWVFTAGYFLVNLERFSTHIVGISPLHGEDVIAAVLFLVLVLECARRFSGGWLPVCALIFVAYVFLAPFIPGLFHRPPMEFRDLVERLVFSTDGVFGFAIAVASSYVFLFVLFGQFLSMVGGGKFFFDFANAIAGRAAGGSAKVAVISSGLFGMISGSPAADVVTTGSFTIPAMKKSGIPGVYAAAVEAVACTGGSLMPPVMGSVAFLMADMLGRPYIEIAKAAILPALIYYFSLYLMVHLQVKQLGLPRTKEEDIVPLRRVMTYSAGFIVPLCVIVVLLVLGYTAIRAALCAIIATMIVGFFNPQPGKPRLNFRQIGEALEQGSLGNRTVNSACACAGIMAGVIFFTGMGGKIGSSIMAMSQGSLLPALILAMLTSVVIGLGVTVSATYILVALLIVPAAVKAGVPALAAHFFVFQYAVLSHITPPVAVPPYIAAGIAGEDPMKVGFAAWRFGIITFLIPFLYVYEPGLLLIGTVPQIIVAICKAILATILLDCSIVGYMLLKMSAGERALCTVGGLAMLYTGFFVPGVGLALGLMVFAWQYRKLSQQNLLLGMQEVG